MPDIIYEINTDGNPFKEAQNKLKPEQKEKITKEEKTMLDMGVIQPSSSHKLPVCYE